MLGPSVRFVAALAALLAASATDAALTSGGVFTLPSGGIGGTLSTVNSGFVSSSGDGYYAYGKVSTLATVIVQDGFEAATTKPAYIGVPMSITTFSSTTTSVCLYLVNAAGLATLNTTSFVNVATCPTLSSGVAVAATPSNGQWSAQCTGSVTTQTYLTSTKSSCKNGAAAYVNKTNPLVYQASQFGPTVTDANSPGDFYQMYFVAIVTSGVPAGGMNISMALGLNPLVALSPPPPSPPMPPSPPSPVNAALSLLPATWTLAFALLVGQLLFQLMR